MSSGAYCILLGVVSLLLIGLLEPFGAVLGSLIAVAVMTALHVTLKRLGVLDEKEKDNTD